MSGVQFYDHESVKVMLNENGIDAQIRIDVHKLGECISSLYPHTHTHTTTIKVLYFNGGFPRNHREEKHFSHTHTHTHSTIDTCNLQSPSGWAIQKQKPH